MPKTLFRTQSNSSTSSGTSSGDLEPAAARLNQSYDLIRVIDEGSTSKVWLARHVDYPQCEFAVKIMEQAYMKLKKSKKRVKKEWEILESLEHEGVVKVFEYSEEGLVF